MSEIGELTFGVSIKQCKDCEYKNRDLRDNLLVTAGVRAGFMWESGDIKLPSGLEGEDDVANYISREVDYYLASDDRDSFDLFIEESLLARYGVKNEENE